MDLREAWMEMNPFFSTLCTRISDNFTEQQVLVDTEMRVKDKQIVIRV